MSRAAAAGAVRRVGDYVTVRGTGIVREAKRLDRSDGGDRGCVVATAVPGRLGTPDRRLSAREREVAVLVADGLKDAVIARRLGLRPGTVNTYIRRIRGRLQLDRRAEIAARVAVDAFPAVPAAAPRLLCHVH